MTINVSCPVCKGKVHVRGVLPNATTIHRLTCRRCKSKIQTKVAPQRISVGIAHFIESIELLGTK